MSRKQKILWYLTESILVPIVVSVVTSILTFLGIYYLIAQ